jgi:hypothetical protein
MVRSLSALPAIATVTTLAIPSLAIPSLARADTVGIDRALPATTRAFEITLGGGYAQGMGGIASDMASVGDLAGPGGTFELKVGYRFTRRIAWGAYGTVAGYDRGDRVADSALVSGASAGLFTDLHLRPDATIDPWISWSSGWRTLWTSDDDGADTTLHGLDLARLQLGVDYRVSPTLALSPMIGAAVTRFLAEKGPDTRGFDEIDDPELTLHVFGGVQGRFTLASR